MLRARFVEGTLARCWRWAAAAVLGVAAANASAYTVSLTPATQTVSLGTEVVVDLVLTDLGPDGLGSFDFNVSFDGTRLDFLSFTDGGALDVSFGLTVIETGAAFTIYDFSLADPAALLTLQQSAGPSLTLATFRFGTLAAGTAGLGLSLGTVSDVFGNVVTFSQADAEVVIADRPTTAVPEPGTGALLLASGLAAIALRRRQRT